MRRSWGSFEAQDRHADLFGDRKVRTFDERPDAVAYARRRSEDGTPCDVFDTATGDLIYRREMDIEAERAQRPLFG